MNKMPDKANEMRNDHQGCIVSSPVTTLMSSLNRRVKPSSIRAKRRKMSSRSNNNGRGSSSSVHVDTEYECCDSLSTTNWVEVLFLQTGQFNSKHFHAQGGKKDIMDVAITPEWRPSSPTDNKLSGTVEVDSPKRLLPASFMKVTPSSDSQEDDEVESDFSDNSIEDMSVSMVAHVSNQKELPEKPTLSPFLTAQSPLATANIKSFLTTDKLCALPAVVSKELLQLLPQCDWESIAMNESKALDYSLNNEYVNGALREWQDHLALGILPNTKTLPSKIDHTPSWKRNNKEDQVSNGLSSILLSGTPSHDNLSANQLCVYKALFESLPITTPTPQTTPTQQITPTPSTLIIKSTLPVAVPRQHYNLLNHSRKQILSEHSYCKPHPSNHTSLSLSLKTRCMCLHTPLRMCTLCHKFYHGICSKGNSICQYCVRRKELDTLS